MSTRPYVTVLCDGITPRGDFCNETFNASHEYLAGCENDYGLLLCPECLDTYDNQGTPVDEESWKEAQWEFFTDR